MPPRVPRPPDPFQALNQRQKDLERARQVANAKILSRQIQDPIRRLAARQRDLAREIEAQPRQIRTPSGQFGHKRAGTYRESENHPGNWVIDYTPSVGVPRRTVRAAYDAEREALRVVFARGPADRVTWEYKGVTEEMARDFTRQASPGRWINSSGINDHPHGNARFDAADDTLEIDF